MSADADVVFVNGEVHTLGEPDETYEALAVRDGRVSRLDSDYEVDFSVGVETDVIDLGGRVLLPGFVDAHVHFATTGRYRVEADLRDAADRGECVDALREQAAASEGWVLGWGFDESTWPDGAPTRADLDAVSETRPVAAVRVDMHTAVLNGVALERLDAAMPAGDVGEDGRIVENAVDALYEAVEPSPAEMRELLAAAQRHANARGVTAVHDMVRRSNAPAVYREMAAEGDLSVRVRLNYWADHLDALEELGARTNHGSEWVETGAVKTFTDGSLGAGTAKLSEPYADSGGTGQWVVEPEELREIVRRADAAGLQVAAHAIGDEAIEAVLDAYETETPNPGKMRHRLEHAELATDAQIERLAELGVVASMQPNFHRWTGADGLYADRLGPERRRGTNRFRAVADAGAHLAFSSDSMPLDPLYGVAFAVDPPTGEALSVTEALRAYTAGGAYAGFSEDRRGALAVGSDADLVVLDGSPWEADELTDVAVAMTVVDGDVVYDARP
ncbi:amidohydrolase [Halarchaeum sp. CBA1220]|uniref:amidohydrolase n=1 Tax=Halarchaeum sp. CBA1220 TaxID=1853682 RepID=UPI000F3A8A78|nr:amidohydrolase [Halarchaeum sp. CBA1220]QLC33020.1 amidohydrolase [Halarchaeum sp. CBA1220]